MSISVQKPKRAARPIQRPRVQVVPEESLLTFEQWLAMPDTKPRYELIEGKLVQKMTTNNSHAWAVGGLLVACKNWGDERGWKFLPEGTAVRIKGRNGYVPDIIGFPPETVLDPTASYNERPFIVVEVLSRATAKSDRTRKKQNYAEMQIPLYIIIDPKRHTFEVHRLDKGTYGEPEVLRDKDVWQPSELPGLRLELARLWLD